MKLTSTVESGAPSDSRSISSVHLWEEGSSTKTAEMDKVCSQPVLPASRPSTSEAMHLQTGPAGRLVADLAGGTAVNIQLAMGIGCAEDNGLARVGGGGKVRSCCRIGSASTMLGANASSGAHSCISSLDSSRMR